LLKDESRMSFLNTLEKEKTHKGAFLKIIIGFKLKFCDVEDTSKNLCFLNF
jgi:hypothetical protein